MKTITTQLALILLSFNLSAQGSIQSITMEPTAPNSNDTILLIANLQFSYSSCGLDYNSHSISGNTIYGTSHHCLGMLTSICNAVDTFVMLPPHNPGTYGFELTLTSGAAPAPCTPGFAPNDFMNYSFEILPVILPPAPGKVVVIESASGTWCGWCPRGTVNMLYMEDTYGDTVEPISIHNGDPMTVPNYDNSFTSSLPGFIGWPQGQIDRMNWTDPQDYENAYLNRVSTPPTALINNSVNYNNVTRELTVDVSTEFVTDTTGDWRLACVLTEDSVQGSTSGYNYTNYYAGGGAGPMGGFETLPNPVPANQMYYPFVARAIKPGFSGQANSFPASIISGTPYANSFTFLLDTSWVPENINVISFVIGPDSIIDNAGTLDLYNYLDVTDLSDEIYMNLYPNPTINKSTLSFFLRNPEHISIELKDLNGKLIAEQDYGQMNGRVELPVMVNNLSSGNYFLHVHVGSTSQVLKLHVQ